MNFLDSFIYEAKDYIDFAREESKSIENSFRKLGKQFVMGAVSPFILPIYSFVKRAEESTMWDYGEEYTGGSLR